MFEGADKTAAPRGYFNILWKRKHLKQCSSRADVSVVGLDFFSHFPITLSDSQIVSNYAKLHFGSVISIKIEHVVGQHIVKRAVNLVFHH